MSHLLRMLTPPPTTTCPNEVLEVFHAALYEPRVQREYVRVGKIIWRVGRGCAGGVPNDVRADAMHSMPPKGFRPEYAERGKSISCFIEPSSDGVPLQPPPPLSKGAESTLHLSLQ